MSKFINLIWKLYLFAVLFVGVSAQAQDEVVYFHPDAQGTATMAYTETGELCWEQFYTPYGEKLDDADLVSDVSGCGLLGGERGFTGHVQDVESGLVYMQQRYYDPRLMRFRSIDPVGVIPEDHRLHNMYAYAFNNPIRFTDPDGRYGSDYGFLNKDGTTTAIPSLLEDTPGGGDDRNNDRNFYFDLNKKHLVQHDNPEPIPDALLLAISGMTFANPATAGARMAGPSIFSRIAAFFGGASTNAFRVGNSVGAAAARISVKGASHLAEGSKVVNIRKITDGRGIREVGRLVEQYGGKAKNWKKRSGDANVVTTSGSTRRAEVHWYEAHGVGKVEFKVKAWLD